MCSIKGDEEKNRKNPFFFRNLPVAQENKLNEFCHVKYQVRREAGFIDYRDLKRWK